MNLMKQLNPKLKTIFLLLNHNFRKLTHLYIDAKNFYQEWINIGNLVESFEKWIDAKMFINEKMNNPASILQFDDKDETESTVIIQFNYCNALFYR